MGSNILTIADILVEPPSDTMAFRTITMLSHVDLDMNILLQTTQDLKDLYYHWMKPKGLLDYIDYILNEKEFESGIRVDVIGIYPQTIIVRSIRFENQLIILGRIKSLAGRE